MPEGRKVLDFTVKLDGVLWQKPNRGAIVNATVIDGDLPSGEKWILRMPYSATDDNGVQPGQWWRVHGEHERYQGEPQIGVTEATFLPPSGEHIKDLLAGDKDRFPGIGTAYAEKLWDKLGQELFYLLEKKDEVALAQVMRELKISTPRVMAETMVKGLADLGIGRVICWLDNLPVKGKFGIKLGRRICRCWGAEAQQRVEEDPYRLLSFYKEPRYEKFEWAAWKKVDEIAQRVFGIAEDDERRLHGAVIEAIYKAYDNKNTIVDRTTLLEKVKGRLGSEELAIEALSRSYGKNSYLHNDQWFQARGVFLMEEDVANRLVRIHRYKQYELFGEKPRNANEIEKYITEFEDKEGYMLAPEQREAVHLCLNNNLSVVTGGAGTGKTSVLKCIFYVLKKSKGEIAQMAVAGRAARRMTQATGYPALTIAGFLNETDRQYRSADVTFVIDEASMLDLPMTYRILRQLPEGCRLILVGDAEQLPPIGPGLVFHLLAKTMFGIVPAVKLVRIFRQDDKSGIPAVAAAIRGDQVNSPILPDLPEYKGTGNGVSVYHAKEGEIASALQGIYADLCETKTGERDPNADVQILAIISKDKPHGVQGINRAFHAKYSKGKKRVLGYTEEQAPWAAPAQFAEGEPVIWKHNEWERNLFNGTLGVIEKAYDSPVTEKADPGEHLSAKINFDTGKQDVMIADLASIDLAYAITVHKSQGSQFKRVVIPIVKGNLLDKALVYTAVTRGVEQVVLVGDIEAAKKAVVDGAAADKRDVGLGHMLKLVFER